MKNHYILIGLITLIFSFFTSEHTHAQGIYQMWSTTVKGGPDDKGVLFSTKYDATGYAVQKQFTVAKSGNPSTFNKPLVYNNKFYNIVGGYGGLNSSGTISSYDPATDTYAELADLFSIGASISNGSFVLYNNKMYGTSFRGGFNDMGTIFEFNPANNSLTKLYDFATLTGNYPVSGLVVYNNKLYGTTSGGGANGDGVIYSFNPATNTYDNVVNFNDPVSGKGGRGSLAAYAGALWGATNSGGLNDKGVLFSYDPDTDVFTKKKDFSTINSKYQSGKLTVLNGKLYGTSGQGGTDDRGVIYEYTPLSNVLVAKHSFTLNDGHNNMEFAVADNILYGAGEAGGLYGDGAIISFDPNTNIFINLIDVGGDLGASPSGSMALYNGRLYGFNRAGGYNKQGTLFTYGPAENSYVNLVHFGGKELQKPSGPLNYYNNKIYGTTWDGGNNLSGGVFNFDPASDFFNIKLHYSGQTITTNPYVGGFVELNNKFYGIATLSGPAFAGIYEFDPANNTYLLKHSFTAATGTSPYAVLTVYNGKLYGTCTYGANLGDGNIFEFDPATNTYTIKANFIKAVTGETPGGRLCAYGSKLYGMCTYGGANGKGTFYEFNPANNNLAKRYDFSVDMGTYPEGGITASNGKLYGVTKSGGTNNMGVVFEYDPIANLLIKKTDLSATTGGNPTSSLTLLNNKLYTITNSGGANNFGTLLQFDPLTGNAVKKTDMSAINGNGVKSQELLAIPALTAPGSPGSCINTQTININAANANEWIQYTDAEGRAVAEINANGNILGNTAVRMYINGDNIRQNGDGVFYLDRNITITPTSQPATTVSVRLYIRKSEFDALKATAGSGINVPADLKIFKNNDFCAADMSAATELTTVKSDWATDYVYATEVSSFSSFYFAKTTGVLPIKLLSFAGKKEAVVNKLTWKVTCTNNANFTIERSQDGINFSSIGSVQATQQDCNMPFAFDDQTPIAGKGFYRLRLTENNGPVTYSQIIILDRNADDVTNLQIFPNPVVGSVVTAQVNAMENSSALITVTDMSGRKVISKNIIVTKGINSIVLNTEKLASGIYALVYNDGRAKQAVRFMKK